MEPATRRPWLMGLDEPREAIPAPDPTEAETIYVEQARRNVLLALRENRLKESERHHRRSLIFLWGVQAAGFWILVETGRALIQAQQGGAPWAAVMTFLFFVAAAGISVGAYYALGGGRRDE